MPSDVVTPCQNRACITVQVMNKHAVPVGVMANANVRVSVGTDTHTLDTDANGMVTFIYNAATDFSRKKVQVQLTDATLAWQGEGDSGTQTQLRVPIEGKFVLEVELYTSKPGTGTIPWPHAWAVPPALQVVSTNGLGAGNSTIAFAASTDATPASEIRKRSLACNTEHTLTAGFPSCLDSSTARIWVDEQAADVSTDEGSHADVTWIGTGKNALRVRARRNGAVVRVRFCLDFRQALVVGEGTGFEYTMGLASKYADANGAKGFRWVVATQYDVIDPTTLPRRVKIKNWQTGANIDDADLQRLVQTACARNLIIHRVQFDATNAAHWAAAETRYGRFDAVLFNNPHPGYGMHMCEVLGLTTAVDEDSDRLSKKNGRAISVYSFGYPATLNPAQLRRFQTAIEPWAFKTQRQFMRGNGANELDYRNVPGMAIGTQYDPANTDILVLDIENAFRYEQDGSAIDHGWYGEPGEMGSIKSKQYRSVVDTLGLQQFLLRSYRYHGLSVIKAGGALLVNGSSQWADVLTHGFHFRVGPALHHVGAMRNAGKWGGRAPHEYFVHYRTNFTSTSHHPSWYSNTEFAPFEPGIVNANVYEFKP